jgi:hypothetical protein
VRIKGFVPTDSEGIENMPVPRFQYDVVVAIEGTPDEIALLNDQRNMEARSQLAGLIDGPDYVVSLIDFLLYGKSKVPRDIIESYFANTASRLKNDIEMDWSDARVLARTPMTRGMHGEYAGVHVTKNIADVRFPIGDLIACRLKLAQLVERAPGDLPNFEFALEFIDFASALLAMKNVAAPTEGGP